MFDFLNKLSHSHQYPTAEKEIVRQEAVHEMLNSSSASENNFKMEQDGELVLSVLPKKSTRPQNKQHKNLKRANSIVTKMQERKKIELDSTVRSEFMNILGSSQGGMSKYLQSNLKGLKQKIEKKVYIRQMSQDEEEYFQKVSDVTKLQNNFLNQQIAATLNGVLSSITRDIEDQKFDLHFKRKRVQNSQEKKMQALKLIKLQQSQLHQKIGQLNVEFKEQNFIDRRAKQIIDKSQYQPQNIKTKLAEQFVKNLQHEKQEKKMKLQQLKERKRSIQIKNKIQQQIYVQKAKQQKHLKLIEQFVQKQKAKKEKQQQSRVQQLNYKQFLKEFKQQKPLFVKKQEEFKQKQKEEKIERYEILKKQQAKYDPLDVQALQMHEERYLELKKQDKQRKQAQMDLEKHQLKLRQKEIKQKAYKGRFRYIVLKEMADAQEKKKQKQEQKQAILQKKHAYSLQVKQRFKPSVDPSKRNEIMQIINSHKSRKRKYLTPNRVAYSERHSTIGFHPGTYSQAETEPDPKAQGKRYHRLFKQYIREKIDKNQVRLNEDKTLQPIVQRRPDYLKQIRQKYSDKIPSPAQRLNRQIQNCREIDDYRILLLKASQFEDKAKQREKKIRNAPHKPQQEARLEEEYLCAIKAKMELINNIK